MNKAQVTFVSWKVMVKSCACFPLFAVNKGPPDEMPPFTLP